jgi:hypothetical protein
MIMIAIRLAAQAQPVALQSAAFLRENPLKYAAFCVKRGEIPASCTETSSGEAQPAWHLAG